MRALIYIIVILILYNSSFTLAQVNSFIKTYVPGYSNSLISDKKNEYLIIGHKTIPVEGNPNGLLIIKTNFAGDTLWTKTYGNINNNTEGINIIETTSDDYIVCANVFYPEPHSIGPSDIILTKLNVNGDTLWWKTYNINDSKIDNSNELLRYNNSIYLVGRNGNDGLLFKTDENGKILFNKTFSFGSGVTEFNSLKIIDDSTLFLFGSVSSIIPSNLIFSKFALCKINLAGDSLSSSIFGEDSCEVFPYSFIKMLDGNFVFSGYIHNFSTQAEYTLIEKINDKGEVVWEKRLDFNTGKLAATSDSGIVFYRKGNTGSVILTKFKNEYNVLWLREIPFPGSQEIECTGIAEANDGGLIITGYVTFQNELPKVFLLKTSSEGILTRINIENTFPNSFVLSQNYPNPFNPSTKISYSVPKSSLVTIKVYDALGKEITTLVNEEKSAGNYEVDFDGSNFSSGVYFYRMQAGSFTDTKKFVLLR